MKMASNKTNRDGGRETHPAVEWISLPTKEATKTNWINIADSPQLKEVSVPKRNLTVSPETLTVLEEAEKLIEDAERQLSMINCQAFIAHDLEPDRCGDALGEEELYVRDVVASMFESGLYNPKTSIKVGDAHLTMKLNSRDERRLKSHDRMSNRPGFSAKSLKKIETAAVPSLEEVTEEQECLVCKTNGTFTTRNFPRGDKNEETESSEKTKCKESMENAEIKRMSVHNGPNIDIKGEFSIQTSGVVDIKPVESARRGPTTEAAPNVATFQVRHGSLVRRNHSHPDSSLTQQNKIILDQDDCRKSTTAADSTSSEKDSESNESESKRCEVKSHGALDSNLLNDSISLQEIFFNDRFAGRSEVMQSDDELHLEESNGYLDWGTDTSLKEPEILPEIDLLLNQRQKFIQRVNNVIEECDKFLVTRSLYSNFPCLKIATAVGREDDAEKNRLTQKHSDLDTRKKGRYEVPRVSSFIESIASNEEMSGEDGGSDCEHIANSIQENSLEKSQKIVRQVSKDQQSMISNSISSNSNEQSNYSGDVMNNAHKGSIPSEDSSSQSKKSADAISSTVEVILDSFSSQSRNSSTEIQKQSIDQIPSINNTTFFVQNSDHSDKRPSSSFIENFRNIAIFEADTQDANHNKTDERETSEHSKMAQQGDIPINTVFADINDGNILEHRNIIYSRTKPSVSDKNDEQRYLLNEHSERRKKRENITTSGNENGKAETGQIEKNCLKTNGTSLEQNFSPNESEYNSSCRDSLGLLYISHFDQEQDDKSLENEKEETNESVNLDLEQKIRNESSVTDNDASLVTLKDQMKCNANGFSRVNIIRDSIAEPRNSLVSFDGLDQMKIIDFVTTDDAKPVCTDKLLKTRSLLANLSRNSVENSRQNGELSLLKQLETYSIPRNEMERKLLTSTVIGDVGQSCDFIKPEETPESSVETRSEGEIFISSSDTYSLGEIRRGYGSGRSHPTT